MRRFLRAVVVGATCMLMHASCTDVSLMRFSEQHALERAEIRGEVCVVDEERLANTLYVIVADVSVSMRVNDPNADLVVAVQRAVDQILDSPGAEVAMIAYSDVPHVLATPTDDAEQLAAATRQFAVRQGGTNYTDTMRAVSELIVDQIDLLPSGVASATQVFVKFFSDGFPTVGGTVPELILPIVDDMVEATSTKVADLSLDTFFLPGPFGAAEDVAAAEVLLNDMAVRGNGEFVRFTDPDSIAFDVETTTLTIRQSLVGVTAFLQNAVFDQGWQVDADGDGFFDEDEMSRGMNPASGDSDNDGLRDGVEIFLAGRFDPMRPNNECADLNKRSTDDDRDGLNLCEETVLGTSDIKVDSDNDMVPDPFEVARGSNPLIDNPLFDRDGDGGPDQVLDVPAGFDARRPNSPDDFATEALIYSFGASDPDRGSTDEDGTAMEALEGELGPETTRCFSVRVDNVPVVAGHNNIDVVVFLAAEDGEAFGRVARRARGSFFYDSERDILAPANAMLELFDWDFEEW